MRKHIPPLRCTECDKLISKPKANNSGLCSSCNLDFCKKRNRQSKKKTKARNIPFKFKTDRNLCPHCPLKFRNITSFRNHLREAHDLNYRRAK